MKIKTKTLPLIHGKPGQVTLIKGSTLIVLRSKGQKPRAKSQKLRAKS